MWRGSFSTAFCACQIERESAPLLSTTGDKTILMDGLIAHSSYTMGQKLALEGTQQGILRFGHAFEFSREYGCQNIHLFGKLQLPAPNLNGSMHCSGVAQVSVRSFRTCNAVLFWLVGRCKNSLRTEMCRRHNSSYF